MKISLSRILILVGMMLVAILILHTVTTQKPSAPVIGNERTEPQPPAVLVNLNRDNFPGDIGRDLFNALVTKEEQGQLVRSDSAPTLSIQPVGNLPLNPEGHPTSIQVEVTFGNHKFSVEAVERKDESQQIPGQDPTVIADADYQRLINATATELINKLRELNQSQ